MPARISEGDRESHRMAQSFSSPRLEYQRRTLQMPGADPLLHRAFSSVAGFGGQTDTGEQVEYTRALERTMSKDPDVIHPRNENRVETRRINDTILVSSLSLYFKSTDVYNERWQNAWIIPAFWQVVSFSLLCIICALWAPSQNSMRYAYSDDGEEFDKDATLTLIKPSPLLPKDVRNQPEVRPTLGNNELSNVDDVEDKTE